MKTIIIFLLVPIMLPACSRESTPLHFATLQSSNVNNHIPLPNFAASASNAVLPANNTAPQCTAHSVPPTLTWNVSTIQFFLDVVTPPDRAMDDARFARILTNIVLAQGTRVPTNAIEFVHLLYNIKTTNHYDALELIEPIFHATNGALVDVFICAITNFSHELRLLRSESYEGERHVLRLKISHSIDALRKIGLPEVINRLNVLGVEMKRQGYSTMASGTIDPDKYPDEARKWLMSYPVEDVQTSMAERWYKSNRPETVDVLREYIVKISSLPHTSEFWQNYLDGDDNPSFTREREIERLTIITDERERAYKRWIEDKKRYQVRDGLYLDRNWEDYHHKKGPFATNTPPAQAPLHSQYTPQGAE